MTMEVKLTDEEYKALLEKAKEEVRDELTWEAVENYMRETDHMYLVDLFRKQLNINGKYEAMKEKKLKDLTQNDILIFMLYNIMYNKVVY